MANSSISCYPENLSERIFWNCDLPGYRKRLDIESGRLLGDELNASVDFLTLQNPTNGFLSSQVRTEDGMQTTVSQSAGNASFPQCQYALIHAPSSRKKLNITKAMLQALLSQYEVMPTFLDFLFTFGKQSFKKNFHYSGFRTKEIAGGTQLFAKVPTISDTTSKYQMCYNLRSVEPTSNPPDWQWSIRQTAVFHSFDMLSGNTNWITVKGNRDMFDSFKQVTRPSAPSCPNHYNSKAGAFDASLAAHLVFCEWSSKNWAEYVGFLEERLQTKTRYALLATVEHPERQDAEIARPDRTETVPVALPRRFTLTEGRKAVQKGFRSLLATHRETSKAVSAKDLELGLMDEKHVADSGFEDFSYDDLRKIQFVEDQTNIAHLVVKSNISILSDLKSYYTNLEASKEFCEVYGTECDVAISRFSSQVTAIINDLRLQQSRLETLLRLIADRKSLLFQLFEHRNMSANKAFTKKAQQSADNMELLTREMRAIATKTEAETIFMRIVTLVTLFFLPGTFVATLMSTDIVKFQNNGDLIHVFSGPAFGLYIGITVPIMLVTFLVAYRVKKREQKRTALQRKSEQAEG